jgi:hypothetical protein
MPRGCRTDVITLLWSRRVNIRAATDGVIISTASFDVKSLLFGRLTSMGKPRPGKRGTTVRDNSANPLWPYGRSDQQILRLRSARFL